MILKKISIVILTYNSSQIILDCLRSILRNNDIGDFLEIIVVDNNSIDVDKMFNLIEDSISFDVKLIKNKVNSGYGAGNNIGVFFSQSPIIMIVNPDVRFLDLKLSKVLHRFENSTVSMLGFKQMISERKKGLSFSLNLENMGIIGILFSYFSNVFNFYYQKCMYLSGSCFAIRKDVFLAVGSFDENFFLYGEENDLHFRFLKFYPNSKILFDKSLVYLHLSDNRPVSDNSLKLMFESNLLFCKKNNLDAKLYINKLLKVARFYKFIEILRLRNSNVKSYNNYINFLNAELLKL